MASRCCIVRVSGLIALGFVAGCFDPAVSEDDDGSSTGTSAGSSSTAAMTLSTTDMGGTTTNSTTDPSTTNSTTDPSTTNSTTDPSTTTGTSSGTDSSSSTGEPVPPLCDDGIPTQDELCYGDPVELSFQDFPLAIEFAEINGDGNLDVAIAIVDEVQYVLGDGAGGFGDTTSSTTFEIQTADFIDANGDGLTDLAFTSYESETSQNARLAVSDGVAFQIASGGSTVPSVDRLRAGNIRGGNDFDVAYFSSDSRARVRAGSGLGIGAELSSVGLSARAQDAVVADVNDDGRDDVIVSLPGETPRVVRYLAASTGELVSGMELLAPLGIAGVGLGAVTAGDFNGDGDVDVAIAVEAAVVVAFSDGLDTFENPTLLATSVPANELHAEDLDGDGSDELLAAFGSGNEGTTSLYFVDDDGFSRGEDLETGFAGFHLDTADVNADTVPDILIGDRLNGVAAVFVSTP